MTLTRRHLLHGAAAGALAALLPGCATNPVLGREQVLLVSEGQMAQLGSGTWNQLLQRKRVSRDPEYNARVGRVGRRLVEAAGLGGQRWEYAVFEDDDANAFVLPGGKVGVTTGILDLMENDDQVAVVLAHEIAHVAGRHAAERYSQSQLANLGGALLSAGLQSGNVAYAGDIAAVLGAGVSYGVILPYSRRHELEADTLGLRYMAAAGYDPREARAFWTRMAAAPGRARPPEFMSTHPADSTRLQNIDAQLRAMGVAFLAPPGRGLAQGCGAGCVHRA